MKLIRRLATTTLALVVFAGSPPRNTVIKSKAGGWPAAIICLQLLIVTAISIFLLGDPMDGTAMMVGLLIIFSGLLL